MFRLLSLVCLLVSMYSVQAQNCSFRLSGHIEDKDTKEKLAGATLLIKELNKSALSDNNGDFLFNGLCAGKYTLVISHASCDTISELLDLQKDMHFDFKLLHASKTLEKVVVSASKGIQSSGFKKELSGIALQEAKTGSLAEALSRLTGVTMLQTGNTIAKPVIHGLHGSRILTINNGVRQEGQQWGNEHAPEIDTYLADKLLVIKGVDELRYGSDAIGGVVIVDTKPLRTTVGTSGVLHTAYATNNQEYIASAQFEQRLKKADAFAYRLQGTFKNGANVMTPNYRLNNTGMQEINFSVTAGYKKKLWSTELFYSHFFTQVGIFTGSHIGNITDLEKAIASDRPDASFLNEQSYQIKRPRQQVTHDLIKSQTSYNLNGHKISLLVAAQINSRQEYDIVRSASSKPQLDLNIATLTEDISWERPRTGRHQGSSGVVTMQQNNVYSGRYFIPNYFATNYGVYDIEKWFFGKWELQAGARFDFKNIATTRLKFNGDTLDNTFKFTTFGASVTGIYNWTDQWKLIGSFSRATRAPYVNELLSDGIHHGTATYEKGDIKLVPEKSSNLSITVQHHDRADKWQMELLFYGNYINDFIYQQPKPDAPVLTIAGAFPLWQYEQTDAFLYGLDGQTNLKVTKSLEWDVKWSILYARNRKTNDWLIMMPANRYNSGLKYTFKDGLKRSNSYLNLEYQYVDKQRRVPTANGLKYDYKAAPAAYQLVNLSVGTDTEWWDHKFNFSISARNLFNVTYRDYLNAMRYFTDEMGRNIIVRASFNL